MLNYLYAILESEATIAAHRMGFDPTLGLMHADKALPGVAGFGPDGAGQASS